MERRCRIIAAGMFALAFLSCCCPAQAQYADHPALISAVLEGPTLTDRITGRPMRFTRAGCAYCTDGRVKDPNQPRFDKIAVCNRPSYVLHSDYDTENIVALAYAEGYFWGAAVWAALPTAGYVYRSLDAYDWQPVASLPCRFIQLIYVTNDGLVLIGTRAPGAVYAWDSDSQQSILVLTMLSESPWAMHWSWAEADGVIYVGEYGNKVIADNSRRIYRSPDGGWTWELLYDPPPQQPYHVHKVLADPYRNGDIYWSHGDSIGGGSSELFRSSDQGQTWQLLSDSEQPTAGVARPEAVYFGSDSWAGGVYRFPDGGDQAEYVCTRLIDGYIWDMADYDGLLYATSIYYDLGRLPTVVVSRDGEHWASLFQWDDRVCGLRRFAASVNGRVFGPFMAQQDGTLPATTMSFDAPRIRNSWAISLQPQRQNLFTDRELFGFEGDGSQGWSSPAGCVVQCTDDRPWEGDKSLKVTFDCDASAVFLYSPSVNGYFTAGQVVSAQLYVSGWGALGSVGLMIQDKTNGINSSYAGVKPGTTWAPLVQTFTLPADSQQLGIRIVGWNTHMDRSVFLDGVCLSVGQPTAGGAGPHCEFAAESLSQQIEYPQSWTDVFLWEYPYHPGLMPLDRCTVKTWLDTQSDSRLELVIDNSGRFTLEETASQTTQQLITIDPDSLLNGSLVHLALVQGPNDITLHVVSPRGMLSDNTSRSSVHPTEVYFGSTADGTCQAGGSYSNGRLYAGPLTPDQIVAVIDDIASAGFLVGDITGDGDVTFSDLTPLTRSWLTEGSQTNDWCSGADMNMDGLVNAADLSVIAQNWYWQP